MVIKRVGMLTVVEHLPDSWYRCICNCGVGRMVRVGHFNTGKIKSCGCHVKRHGHSSSKGVTRTYVSYHNMIARCHKKTNKRYKDYGAKGLTVCDRWRGSFTNFLSDMGPCPDGLTIDRTDNRKGYSPDNCKWVTRAENQQNRNNAIIWVVNGKRYNRMQSAADDLGVSTGAIGAWCKGRVAEGRYYGRRKNCYAYRKFTGEPVIKKRA